MTGTDHGRDARELAVGASQYLVYGGLSPRRAT
jgi:hypothetical protein